MMPRPSSTETNASPATGRRLRRCAVLVTVLACGFLYGVVANERDWFPANAVRHAYKLAAGDQSHHPKGRWGRAQPPVHDPNSADFSGLTGLGYLAGNEPAPAKTGVVTYDHDRAGSGFNFFTSGHAPEATLMNMDGEVLHRWECDYDSVWPNRPTQGGNPEYFRRAYLFDNGDIVAVFDRLGLVRLDKDSNVIWAFGEPAHHDVDVDDQGRIYVLTNYRRERPVVRRGTTVLDDHIVVLSGDGTVLDRLSLIDAFADSPFAAVLERVPAREDIMHTNSLEVLDGRLADRNPAFARGNVLVSLREVNVIAVVDMKTRKVAWLLWGMWLHQHQPTVLDNGNMLIFDNLGHYGLSKVFEFDPFAQPAIKSFPYTEFDPLRQKVVWTYEGTIENGFFSRFCGTAQRLDNGNTLITESDAGRVIEVTSRGETVWQYVNTQRAGDDDELIAVIFEMRRLATDFPLDWLGS